MSVTAYRIPELVERHGMRLGRHVRHDDESRRYAIAPRAALAKSTNHKRVVPVFDQGDLGSCTGNAMAGAIGTDGIYETISGRLQSPLDESFAVALYSAATQLDDYPGQYPPDDTGSDGLNVSKAAQSLGWIGGYVHALSLDALITGLQPHAGIMGANWYTSMFNPDPSGVLSIGAHDKVEGGHEWHLLNVNMDLELLECVNSWSVSWGRVGRFFLPFKLAERLLAEDGDATFPTPISVPAPVPADTVTRKFAAADAGQLDEWAKRPHWWAGSTGAAKAWARGLPV